MRPRIHVFGASGSGTTTLGMAVAVSEHLAYHDADDYFWEPTDPPFQRARARDCRVRLLGEALGRLGGWVLAGSVCGWGDDVAREFDLAVLLTVPTDVRLARLSERERARFGRRVEPGGDMEAQHRAFLDWAARYDEGATDVRSRRLHDDWAAGLHCPVLRLDGTRPLPALRDAVVAALAP